MRGLFVVAEPISVGKRFGLSYGEGVLLAAAFVITAVLLWKEGLLRELLNLASKRRDRPA
jgi:hypothetical protein